jgi:hypothetical protein
MGDRIGRFIHEVSLPTRGRAKGKASFCEQKEAKNFLLCWAMGVSVTTPMAQHNKKFLRRFFQKAAAF